MQKEIKINYSTYDLKVRIMGSSYIFCKYFILKLEGGDGDFFADFKNDFFILDMSKTIFLK